jgi:peptidoglycan/LPS O-acetylase OafA/YrhL
VIKVAPMPNKLQYIEGLRGLAAGQVVLLHYCSAFLPVMAHLPGPAHYSWEITLRHSPLYLLIDGYSAVYLFFIMSGFVLAPSFLRSEKSFPQLAFKRFLRLFIPVFAAFSVALALLLLMPNAKTVASTLSHSSWLGAQAHNLLTVKSLISDILLNSMLIGYDGSSLFNYLPNAPRFLAPTAISQALNSPAWTLHVEFWGSMLVLALALLRRFIGGAWFSVIFVFVALMAGTSHYSLFLFGFLLYQLHGTLLNQRHIIVTYFGAALVLLGSYICVNKDVTAVGLVLVSLRDITLLSAQPDFHWQSQVGAMLIFSGVMLNSPLRGCLTGLITQWMGRVSFSVYLLHFPILLTLGCMVFALFAPSSYALACTAAAVVGIGTTYAAAVIFEKSIDRPAVLFSKRIIGESHAAGVSDMKAAAGSIALKK